MSPVVADVAGASMGGAARYVRELRGYLAGSGRTDVEVIGAGRPLTARWLAERELRRPGRGRRVALNNVSFCGPGGSRWTLLGNALHFLTEAETAALDPALAAAVRWQARVVRRAALRSDLLIAPCTAMADRVAAAVPAARRRLVVRPHPVTPLQPAQLQVAQLPPAQPPARTLPLASVPAPPPLAAPPPAPPPPAPAGDPAPAAGQGRGSPAAGQADTQERPVILVPVLFAPYKRMRDRLAELLAALDASHSPAAVRVTAGPAEAGPALAAHPRIELAGRLGPAGLARAWAGARAVYFPTVLESFGYPLAEARAAGLPVIARDTAQNREIAGPALCPYGPAPGSLAQAAARALSHTFRADPAPFDPAAYFGWLLGAPA